MTAPARRSPGVTSPGLAQISPDLGAELDPDRTARSTVRRSFIRLGDHYRTIAAGIVDGVDGEKARRIGEAILDRIDEANRSDLAAWLARPIAETRAEAEARIADVLHRAATAPPPPTWAELRATRGGRP